MNHEKLGTSIRERLMQALRAYSHEAAPALAHQGLKAMSPSSTADVFRYVAQYAYENVKTQTSKTDDPGVMTPDAISVVLTPAAAEALMKVMLETAWSTDEAICRALAFIAEALASHAEVGAER